MYKPIYVTSNSKTSNVYINMDLHKHIFYLLSVKNRSEENTGRKEMFKFEFTQSLFEQFYNVTLENNSNEKTSKYKCTRIHIHPCKSRLVVRRRNLEKQSQVCMCVLHIYSPNSPFGVNFMTPELDYSHIEIALKELTKNLIM